MRGWVDRIEAGWLMWGGGGGRWLAGWLVGWILSLMYSTYYDLYIPPSCYLFLVLFLLFLFQLSFPFT